MPAKTNGAYHSAVFIDLDGTLVERNGNIPPSAIDAIARAQAAGFMVVITTGRMYRSAKYEAERVGINGDSAIISYNGAFAAPVADRRDAIFYNPIRKPLYDEVVATVCRHKPDGLTIFCYYDDELYVDCENGLLMEYVSRTKAVYKKIDDLTTLPESPKVLALASFETPENLLPLHASVGTSFGGRLEYAFSFPNYLEMTAPGTTKGRAIKSVIERYGIPAERTYALGDSHNDVGMFEAVATSVCMGNGDAAVKAKAGFVTGDITEGGFAEAFDRFVLAGR